MLLLIRAGLSFRSIPKALSLLNDAKKTEFWVPHFTSIINWVLRCGLSLLKAVKPAGEPWIAIVDASIGVGTKKVLVILRVPLAIFKRKKKNEAPILEDAECIGVHLSDSWNGESIHEKMVETFNNSGLPVAILKDGGSDIQKGVRLLSESRKEPIEIIDDVGHVASNALESEFSELIIFKDFLEMINLARNRMRQSQASFLAPPKLRSHSRFMSMGRLAKWGKRILKTLKEADKCHDTKLSETINFYLPEMDYYVEFLKRFISTSDGVDSFLKIVKREGIGPLSIIKARIALFMMPSRSITRLKLKEWLKRHQKIRLQLAKKTGDSSLNLMVSSDIIESLFGTFKQIIFRCPSKEYNKSILSIPLLCGKFDYESMTQHLDLTPQNDLNVWQNKIIKTTQLGLKRRFHRGELTGEMV